MSDILMKEMESVSLSTESKEEEEREQEGLEDGVSSFLLVDEQERLRVKFNSA